MNNIDVNARPISDLEMTERTESALIGAGKKTIGDLVKMTEIDLLKLPLVTRRMIVEIKDTLAKNGISANCLLDVPAFSTLAHGINIGDQRIPAEFGMSLRQYAAIKLKVPVSGDEWLDEMIRESLRDEFAGRAMEGLVAAWGSHDVTSFSEFASDAYGMAVAMIEAREVGAS